MEIVIASSNLHKIREIKAILKESFDFDYLSLLDFPDYKPEAEESSSFIENAIVKARSAAKALKGWVISDDSGLVVPYLKGFPGVRSKRYAGEASTDKENRQKLVDALEDVPDKDRNAFYVCSVAVASNEGVVKRAEEGLCEGFLIIPPRGSQGFGYDPLFVKHDYNKTFAEIDESTKNKVSHRRKALDKIIHFLEKEFK